MLEYLTFFKQLMAKFCLLFFWTWHGNPDEKLSLRSYYLLQQVVIKSHVNLFIARALV